MAEVGRRDHMGGARRKRKAENQDNERLSKRLSLLNLGLLILYIYHIAIRANNCFTERNGQKLYVPVEQPSSPTASSSSRPILPAQQAQPQNDDIMQLDDTKHKVYIYDLDAELSDSESSDDGRLVFLPDIQKHLRDTRIPATILANSDGDLAGLNNQLVLYNVPSSLTIPKEQDSVRKAIIETRARARANQRKRNEESRTSQTTTTPVLVNGIDAKEWYNHMTNSHAVNGEASPQMIADDPDAMDMG